MKTILVLGGYGNFGKRISEHLSTIPKIKLLVSGRNFNKASSLVESLKERGNCQLQALVLDIFDNNFRSKLQELSVDLVIHTCGPFQGQDYSIPLACINAGAHYIDLSDDRSFTCHIPSLDRTAKEKNLLIVSGASSVPGLSSTVVDHYQSAFSRIDSIDIAIAPGNKAERGEATIRGILSYTGHSFKVFSEGKWNKAYGWMQPKILDFGDKLGKRWLANVDVPDLTLFPERYKVKKRVSFKAGLELSILHLIMVGMAAITKIGLVRNWAPTTKLIVKVSQWFNRFGTDKGGMQISIKGNDLNGGYQSIKWSLFADNGIGPCIPTISAILLAKKLIAEEIQTRGAIPCLAMYTLEEFEQHIKDLDITTHVEKIQNECEVIVKDYSGENIG